MHYFALAKAKEKIEWGISLACGSSGQMDL